VGNHARLRLLRLEWPRVRPKYIMCSLLTIPISEASGTVAAPRRARAPKATQGSSDLILF
jgi:hypothetical protein